MKENNFLTDLEVKKIETFCADDEMFNAVRKVMLSGIYTHGTVSKEYTSDPLINGAFSLASLSPSNPIPNEQIGQQVRAQWEGINALKNAIDRLRSIKTKVEQIESPFNEAI